MSDQRERRRTSFGGVADAYERARPEYPREAVAWLAEGAATVLDLGAGTGKLTRGLLALGLDVVAVEPDAAMVARLREAVPGARVAPGHAEAIPLPDGVVDVVVAGQAYHWFDPRRALPEIARVLRPSGRLGLGWNVRDERSPWVARLSGLLGAEAWEAGPEESLGASGLFGPVEEARFEHVQELDQAGLRALVSSRSNVAIMDEPEREELLAAVDALFAETAADGRVELPYVTQCFRALRL